MKNELNERWANVSKRENALANQAGSAANEPSDAIRESTAQAAKDQAILAAEASAKHAASVLEKIEVSITRLDKQIAASTSSEHLQKLYLDRVALASQVKEIAHAHGAVAVDDSADEHHGAVHSGDPSREFHHLDAEHEESHHEERGHAYHQANRQWAHNVQMHKAGRVAHR